MLLSPDKWHRGDAYGHPEKRTACQILHYKDSLHSNDVDLMDQTDALFVFFIFYLERQRKLKSGTSQNDKNAQKIKKCRKDETTLTAWSNFYQRKCL